MPGGGVKVKQVQGGKNLLLLVGVGVGKGVYESS